MSTDTDALRGFVERCDHTTGKVHLAVLDALAVELKRWKFDAEKAGADYWAAEAELERVKAERDAQAERLTAYETPGWINSVQKVLDERDKRKAAEARLDKALTALREIASAPTFPIRSDEIARAAIKDIEA
jgi:hypothetical protein